MLTEIDRENVTKAAQCAALLISDVQALASANNQLLAEIGIEALKLAAELDQKLQRLEAISSAQQNA